jgi:hypothetical protein
VKKGGPVHYSVIHYADFQSLSIQNIVSHRNIEHMTAIPDSKLRCIDSITDVIYGIVKAMRSKFICI